MKRTLSAWLVVSAAGLIGLLSATSAYAVHNVGEIDWACHVNPLHECYEFGEQTAEGTNTFKVNGGTVKCTTAKYTGQSTEANGGTTIETAVLINGKWVGTGELDWAFHLLTVHPEFSGCTGFGQNVTITTTGCNLVWTLDSVTSGTESIECETGKSIVVKATTTGCTVTIGAQTPANNTIDVATEGTPSDVKVTTTIGTEPLEKGVTYTSSGGACGSSGSNGALRGTITLKGYSSAAHEKQVPFTPIVTVEIGSSGLSGAARR
jgi:hypothetical protein